ncbi:alpha-mannosidase [Anaeramoeba ignava]|uniref:Alpha-mannosidase n=1 Tax=Anaeramoeba ignava TaxID=1746090 RepID=A0A9Q0LSH8_ANAIG|nr:alpha-mannosidase [Anaeramoeba ignava]
MKTFTFSIIVFLLFLLISFSSHQQLEVFIVPHTHDDPAWLETFMGYYTTRVQYILTNTITDLLQNPTHKFIYVENSFFRYWWDQQNSTMQENVINLIKLKQFEFVNGGYVMNDEAVTNYDMIINQMTIGHQWIKENIGEFAIPKIAFHIDPFGSSNMSPFLFSQMCFDAFVIDRIPWDTKIDYMAYKHMEFIWRGSRNWGSKNEMFTYVCPPILYGTPVPFNWEHNPADNPDITDENLVESADLLVSVWKDRSRGFLHNQLLFLFGDDFEFHYPEKEFGNMDKLLNYINSHQEKYNVTAHYSILSEYFESINKEQVNFPILGADDFFPYYLLDFPIENKWWSGFFTSWPLLKGLIRSSNANLFTIEFANTIYNSKYRTTTPLIQNILPLRNAVALTAHHDAITGTSRPDVNQEQYIDNLISGSNIGDKAFIISLQHGLTKPGNQEPTLSLNQTEMEKVLSKNQTVPIIVFNSLGWTFDEQIISFNLSLTNMDFEIIGTDLNPVESIYDKEIGKLTFIGKVPAIGFSTYFIQLKQSQTNKIIKNVIYPNEFNSQTYTISNKFYSITFSGETGLVILVKNKVTGGLFIIDNNIFRYSTYKSGAYIFDPSDYAEPYSSKVESITQITSELYDEIHQVFASNLTQIWRLYRTNNEDLGRFIEIEHKLGPNLEGNKEVVTRFITSIPSEGVFYQTNNDLEIMKRVYNSSECITENYYPFTGACWIEDSNQRLTIITDRAHGITSIESGVIEVMIARRTLQDDGYGLGMPLEDTTYYKSKLWIMFDTIEESERSRHISSLLFNTPFKLTYGISPNIGINEWMNSYLSETTTLCNDLPRNIHLLSLIENEYSTKQGILRLQHLYENDTDSEYSKVVEISLNELFSCNLNGFSPSNYQEQTLSLLMTPNQCSTNQMKWNQNKELNEESKSNSNETENETIDTISIYPMQIRTFLFDY